MMMEESFIFARCSLLFIQTKYLPRALIFRPETIVTIEKIFFKLKSIQMRFKLNDEAVAWRWY